MAQNPAPSFIGWYHEHAIRIYQEGERWRIVFDPLYAAGPAEGQRSVFPWVDDETYASEEIAKRTALALAQHKFHVQLGSPVPVQDQIDWRDLRD